MQNHKIYLKFYSNTFITLPYSVFNIPVLVLATNLCPWLQAELALLMMGEEDKKHFNLRHILEEDKVLKGRKKRRQRKMKKLLGEKAKEVQDDFTVRINHLPIFFGSWKLTIFIQQLGLDTH